MGAVRAVKMPAADPAEAASVALAERLALEEAAAARGVEASDPAWPSPAAAAPPPRAPEALPLSTCDKVLVVAEGTCFRARLGTDGGARGLGVTVKSTSDGRIAVHALPRARPEVPGRAEAAGVRVGDELLGIGDAFFARHTELRALVRRGAEINRRFGPD